MVKLSAVEKFFEKLWDATESITLWYAWAYDEKCHIGMRKDGKDLIIDGVPILISGNPQFSNESLNIHEPINSVEAMDEFFNENIEVYVHGQMMFCNSIVSSSLGNYRVVSKDTKARTVVLQRK